MAADTAHIIQLEKRLREGLMGQLTCVRSAHRNLRNHAARFSAMQWAVLLLLCSLPLHAVAAACDLVVTALLSNVGGVGSSGPAALLITAHELQGPPPSAVALKREAALRFARCSRMMTLQIRRRQLLYAGYNSQCRARNLSIREAGDHDVWFLWRITPRGKVQWPLCLPRLPCVLRYAPDLT
eukprot:1157328-Pelagomonas_calceolata.AAC.16